MKKVLFSVAMIATFVGVMMTSCKKEKETVMSEKVQTEVNDPQNDAVVSRILDFKNKIDERKLHPDTRSGETMTLEEAMNKVVDLFNVTYTEPMAYYAVTEDHAFDLIVPLTIDGEVLEDDVVSTYERVVDLARSAYHASLLSNKGYRRLMVSYELENSNEARFHFNGQYGTKGIPPHTPQPHIDGPFSVGDDWHYKDGMGSCDGLLPGGADKVLQDTIMAEVCTLWPVAPNNCRGFYTNYEIFHFSGTDHSGVFYSTDVEDTCIEWPYMNDYLAGEKRNIFLVVPQEQNINLNGNSMQPYRYYVTNVVIQGDEGVTNGNTPFIYHKTDVEYGRYEYIENATIEHLEL